MGRFFEEVVHHRDKIDALGHASRSLLLKHVLGNWRTPECMVSVFDHAVSVWGSAGCWLTNGHLSVANRSVRGIVLGLHHERLHGEIGIAAVLSSEVAWSVVCGRSW